MLLRRMALGVWGIAEGGEVPDQEQLFPIMHCQCGPSSLWHGKKCPLSTAAPPGDVESASPGGEGVCPSTIPKRKTHLAKHKENEQQHVLTYAWVLRNEPCVLSLK